MALIKCPECDKDISNRAFDCPHCGFPMVKKPRSSSDKLLDVVRHILIILMTGFFIVMALLFLSAVISE